MILLSFGCCYGKIFDNFVIEVTEFGAGDGGRLWYAVNTVQKVTRIISFFQY